MNDIFKPYEGDKKMHIPGKYKLSWTEGALDVEVVQHPELSISHTRSFVGTALEKKYIRILFWFMMGGLCIILGRVFFLQIIKGGYYQSLAEKNRIRLLPIIAERGIIYDRFNKELVENVPNFFLTIIPQALPKNKKDRDAIIERVAKMSEVSPDEIQNKLKKYRISSYQSLTIKDNLDYKTALELYTKNNDLPGILIQSGSKRHYLNNIKIQTTTHRGSSFAHILGYLGKINEEEWESVESKGYLPNDSIGKVGLEKSYETELRGTYGYKKIEVDALEREQSTLAVEPPIQGHNIVLNIDREAQFTLEKIITAHLTKLNKQKAVAIAMNPQNGEILALVSYPFFNNNDFSGGISSTVYKAYLEDKNQPLFNRAIGGIYPPGSTLKLVVAVAALQEKLINIHTTFNSTGGLKISRWFFPDWKAGGHGLTNINKAIAWSVNTFFYYIGGGYGDFKGLGADTILKYFALFNLGQKTGIDIPGEVSGFIPSREWKQKNRNEQWFVGDTYNISIGQGDTTVTPLQVVSWTAAIANGGKLVEPHIVHGMIDPLTKKETKKETKIIKENFIDPYNIEIVRQGMRECVLSGSCKMLQNLPFSTGGKTGTAQWNKNFDPHAWFTAFAPYQNPQIVVTVLIEEGKEGAGAAMPIVDEFLAWWGRAYLTQ